MIFQGQGIVWEFSHRSKKFEKSMHCQKKNREFENEWLWQSAENVPVLLKWKGYSFKKDNQCTELFISLETAFTRKSFLLE